MLKHKEGLASRQSILCLGSYRRFPLTLSRKTKFNRTEFQFSQNQVVYIDLLWSTSNDWLFCRPNWSIAVKRLCDACFFTSANGQYVVAAPVLIYEQEINIHYPYKLGFCYFCQMPPIKQFVLQWFTKVLAYASEISWYLKDIEYFTK